MLIRRGRAMVLLAALGVAIAGYLTAVHFSGALALCAGAGGCETVQASRFATVAGAPVALLGLGLYLALLGLAGWRAARGPAAPDAVPLALFGLALAGTLYSASPDLPGAIRHRRALPLVRRLRAPRRGPLCARGLGPRCLGCRGPGSPHSRAAHR